MSGVTFQEELMSSITHELRPLFEEHYNEVGAFGGLKVGLNIQWTVYKILEEKGMLHFVTARKGNRLAGYYVSIIAPHLHFADTLVAENDTIFITKKYRAGRVGVELIKYAGVLLNKKCKVVLLNLPADKAYTRLASHAGFTLISNTFKLEGV